MFQDTEYQEKYPMLYKYTNPVKKPEREIVGREKEIEKIQAAMLRPEIPNVLLLAPAGSGKSALVQGTMMQDKSRRYLEVDLARMLADVTTDVNQMSAMLKTLFDETAAFHAEQHSEIVLFIDEFHQIVELAPAAVEALKPLLADGGTRGIKVIAATTFDEFIKYISPNQPLVERLQRINLPEPDEKTVCAILRGAARRYGVEGQFPDDSLFELIYEYTNRYIPSNAQPRKSILIMDAMIGWHRLTGKPMNRALLAEMIYQQEGVNVAFRVDAKTIKQRIDERVLSQEFATKTIEDYLQVAVADLNDKERPIGRLLFSGATGVGKSLTNEQLLPAIWQENGSVRTGLKKNGDMKIGDFVFNRYGKPVRVTGVYPQGRLDVYEIKFSDGRTIKCSGEHLWTWARFKGAKPDEHFWRTTTVLEMLEYAKEHGFNMCIPMNGAVEYPEADLPIDPYVLGAFIGDGCARSKRLRLCTDDEFVAIKVANRIGHCTAVREKLGKAEFYFRREEYLKSRHSNWLQTHDVFNGCDEVYGLYSYEKRIPEEYFYGSVEQRFDLLHGLMDTDGGCRTDDGGHHMNDVMYATTSYRLAQDVFRLLLSLGFQGSIFSGSQFVGRKHKLYFVHVNCSILKKDKLFTLPRKKNILMNAIRQYHQTPWRIRRYDTVRIEGIRKLDEQAEMTCIMVDDEEHLYQTDNYIVTHNTETAKALADILFNDQRALQRHDMSEYANADSLERFRQELTDRVWQRPFCILLLDEIEKACAECTRLLLQVLDDARLTNRNGREISFKNCYIIMTTNAGSEAYKIIAQYNADDTGSGQAMQRYHKLIRESLVSTTGGNKFPPELLGRIDAIVPFQPLSESTQMKITRMKLMKLQDKVRQVHGIDMRISPKVIDYLVKDKLDTDSDSGGARAIMSRLETDVTATVARFINENPGVKMIQVKVEGDMAYENKNQLISTAYIKVAGIGSATQR